MNLNSWDYYELNKEIANMKLHELQKIYIREVEAAKALGVQAVHVVEAGGNIDEISKQFKFHEESRYIVALAIAEQLTGVK